MMKAVILSLALVAIASGASLPEYQQQAELVPNGGFAPAYGQQYPLYRQLPSTFSSDVFDVNQLQRAWGTKTKTLGTYLPNYGYNGYNGYNGYPGYPTYGRL